MPGRPVLFRIEEVTDSMPVLGPWPQRMVNPVRPYDWGSLTVLARLQGRTPSGEPEAELWMGAHSAAPSHLLTPDGDHPALDALIAAQPVDLLGYDVHDRFGARLPFLVKLLAIARPLSLQVHPDAERARTAYDDPTLIRGEHRYVDPYPKPELLYALERVDALCGFRSPAAAVRLLGLLELDRCAHLIAPLLTDEREAVGPRNAHAARLEEMFRRLVTWPEDDRVEFAADIARATRRLLSTTGSHRGDDAISPDDRRALTWTRRLAALHPKDPLVAAPLILDLVRLEPGHSLFVPAGAPHAYLYGLGLEIMSSSDNVLRAGLTSKAVAVDELLHVIDGSSRPMHEVPHRWASPYELIIEPPAEEFALSRIWLEHGAPVAAYPRVAGPQIVLCTAGEVSLSCGGGDPLTLRAGESAFIGASGGALTLSGLGEVFRGFAGEGRAR